MGKSLDDYSRIKKGDCPVSPIVYKDDTQSIAEVLVYYNHILPLRLDDLVC